MYALCADKLCTAALSRFPARAYAESKCFCCARNHTEPRLDGGQPGTISELRRDPEGFEKFAMKAIPAVRLERIQSPSGRRIRPEGESGGYWRTVQGRGPYSQRCDYKQKWAYPGQWESPTCSKR